MIDLGGGGGGFNGGGQVGTGGSEPSGALLGDTVTSSPCPPGYARDIACPACVGVTTECVIGGCCRCVGRCQQEGGGPSPNGDGGPTDPWARLAEVLARGLGGGGIALPLPQPQQVAVVPTTRREVPVWGWVLLLVAAGVGVWWYTQRRRRREAA